MVAAVHTLRRSAPPRMVATAIGGITQTFSDALGRAVRDRRRVDELVTLFAYDGAVHIEGSGGATEHRGQGAVKRWLAAFLLDAGFTALEDSGPVGSGGLRVKLRTSCGSVRTLDLRLLVSDGLVHNLHVAEAAVPAGLAPLFVPRPLTTDAVAHTDGPKWETFDGRVRQRIWRRDSMFSPGNTFMKDTLELSTGRVIMVVDATVWKLYEGTLTAWAESVDLKLDAVVAPGNEDQKTLETFTYLLDELKRVDPLRRSEPVVALGGGVLTDTAGFACACWRRGIPWCRIPTTLLGMVDASVGIKVAINYHRKNGVGHFYSPIHTFIDTSFLSTVPLPDIRSGVGEIMKAALIYDRRARRDLAAAIQPSPPNPSTAPGRRIWELLRQNGEQMIAQRFQNSESAAEVIKLSVDAMLECIGPDLWEETLLRPMDFGHSFSRTLEADERFQLRHGAPRAYSRPCRHY